MEKEKNIKTVADDLIKLPIFLLKKNGFFKGIISGDITFNLNGVKNSCHIIVSILTTPYVHFSYSSRQPDGQYKDFEYKVYLATTPCKYGGIRYWFICPAIVDGKCCSRRVGVLYKGGDYFACRHCYNLTYRSRRLSGIYKKFGVINGPELDRQMTDSRWWSYKGKATKRYMRLVKKYEKAEALEKAVNEQMDNKFKKTVEILKSKKGENIYDGEILKKGNMDRLD